MPYMLIYIIVWVLCSVQSKKCYNHSSIEANEAWYCCNNHEEKNGICVECEIGYVSKDGYPCKPCTSGTWGRKCKDTCSCHLNGRCDIVYGCVEMPITISEKWRSTFLEPMESTHDVTSSDTLSATDTNGSIAVMVALASCCFKYQKKKLHFNISRSQRTHRDRASTEQLNAQYNRSNASPYDLIDENNMIGNATLMRSIIRAEHVNQVITRNVPTVDQDDSSNSNSVGDVTDPPSEGYLNPYQPMIEFDVHDYRLLANESKQKSIEISTRSSEASIMSDCQVDDHIHPYEPAIPYVDEHNYTPVVEVLPSHKENVKFLYDSSRNTANADKISDQLLKEIPITVDIDNQERMESFGDEASSR